ncbi:hypothetical protein H1R20_g5163, partial [Candolleomyces eurysporus]
MEVWDRIASYIPRYHLRTWLSVSAFYHEIAARHIFHTLDLYFGEDQDNLHRGLDIFDRAKEDSAFAARIKCLRIHWAYEEDDMLGLVQRIFKHALPAFKSLEEFEWIGYPEMRAEMVKLVLASHPHLHGLGLIGWHFDAVGVSGFRNLRKFTLRAEDDDGFADMGEVRTVLDENEGTLRHLILGAYLERQHSWDSVFQSPTIKNLTHLDLVDTRISHIVLARIAHAHNLQSLTLHGTFEEPSSASVVFNSDQIIDGQHTFLPHLEAFRFVLVGHDDNPGLYQAVTMFLRNRKKLRRLDLGSCPWDLAHAILPKLTNLRVLGVRIANLTAQDVVSLVDAVPQQMVAISITTEVSQRSLTNIFVAAQRGDVAQLRALIESGQASATDRDEQNVTPLHWAAINAHIAACRYLLEQGAEVDALGGDLVATPMQWAARNGYLYIIHLLIAHNADPTITDSQGYNTLHLVTHSSSIMPLLYLLHQPINVDSRDSQGHTSLMWAAYQGDALSVDLLLRHGANPNLKDDAGLTSLHWAVVRGNKVCIRRLVEKGADLSAKDGEDRTPRDMAIELKSLGAWKRALEEGGMNEYGVKRSKPLSDRNTKIAIFILPTIFFYLIFMTLSILPWYTGILLAMAEFFGMHHFVTRVLLNNNTYTDSVNQTPYFAGIITASIIWVVFSWATRLLQQAESHSLSHLMFALSVGLCAYNFFRAITLDPGTCPKPASDDELKQIIEDLASEGRLNGQTFCIQCMARKPLRSKHCRVCDKCIARSDHHCPWVWNCVGSNNHRQFLLFVTTLVTGIGLFDYLTYAYFTNSTISTNPQDISPSCPLPTEICAMTTYDPFLVGVAFWATLQLTWTSVLLASQFWQVARQMTTLEVSNLGRYGFMGGRGGASLSGQMGHRHRHGGTDQIVPGVDSEDASVGGDGASSTGAGHAGHKHSHGCGSGFLMNLLGFDRFTKGKAVDGLARASTASNPFDTGIVSNCKDFWTNGKELGVEYEKLYDVPLEGFKEAKRRREMSDEDNAGSGGRKGSSRGRLFMGLPNPWGPSGSRAGYEPVSQV